MPYTFILSFLCKIVTPFWFMIQRIGTDITAIDWIQNWVNTELGYFINDLVFCGLRLKPAKLNRLILLKASRHPSDMHLVPLGVIPNCLWCFRIQGDEGLGLEYKQSAHKNILLTSKPHKEEKQKLSASAAGYSGRGISRVYFFSLYFTLNFTSLQM